MKFIIRLGLLARGSSYRPPLPTLMVKAVSLCGFRPHIQWRVRSGFSPLSLVQPDVLPTYTFLRKTKTDLFVNRVSGSRLRFAVAVFRNVSLQELPPFRIILCGEFRTTDPTRLEMKLISGLPE